jgi:hypothetical protein
LQRAVPFAVLAPETASPETFGYTFVCRLEILRKPMITLISKVKTGFDKFRVPPNTKVGILTIMANAMVPKRLLKLVKKFLTFYATGMFIIVFTRAHKSNAVCNTL